MDWTRISFPVLLAVQASLLFLRLDLLPIWGDENDTLVRAASSRLFDHLCQSEVHPPLYYLLMCLWLGIPWPAAPLIAARAFSGLCVLATTLLIDRLWLRELSRGSRIAFLALWTLSPCLILYGRMARSYALQLLLAVAVIYLATRLLAKPDRVRYLFAYGVASSLLLYTHYASGSAVIAGVAVCLFFRRQVRTLALSSLVQALLYLPWAGCFARSLERAALHEPHQIGSLALDQIVRLGYWYVAFMGGETPPVWVLASTILLAPAIAFLLWSHLRRPAPWTAIAAIATAFGFLGVSRWVAFAFVPARMLFMLPFFLLALTAGEDRRRLRLAVTVAMLFLSAGSLTNYYSLDGFLNKGYLIPFDAITTEILQQSRAAAILEYDGFDSGVLQSRLGARIPLLRCHAKDAVQTVASARLQFPEASVWYIRRGGASPLAGATRTVGFMPYSEFDRFVMRQLGWPRVPSHVIELIEFRP